MGSILGLVQWIAESGIGHSCGWVSVSAPGTSICYGCGHEKKKKLRNSVICKIKLDLVKHSSVCVCDSVSYGEECRVEKMSTTIPSYSKVGGVASCGETFTSHFLQLFYFYKGICISFVRSFLKDSFTICLALSAHDCKTQLTFPVWLVRISGILPYLYS